MPKAKKVNVSVGSDTTANLARWHQLKAWLEQAEAEEFSLRQWLIQNAGFDTTKLEGSQTIDLGNGWKLKGNKVMNYSVSNENGEALTVQNLVASANLANRPDLAQSLVKWEPKLSISTYREVLTLAEQLPQLKDALAKAVTIKPGAPQLELIPPKKGNNILDTVRHGGAE